MKPDRPRLALQDFDRAYQVGDSKSYEKAQGLAKGLNITTAQKPAQRPVPAKGRR